MTRKKHFWYYALLFGVLAFGLFSILGIKADKASQLLIFIGITLAYITVGIAHHKTEHDLHIKVVIEYILMGLLGIAIMFFLLQ